MIFEKLVDAHQMCCVTRLTINTYYAHNHWLIASDWLRVCRVCLVQQYKTAIVLFVLSLVRHRGCANHFLEMPVSGENIRTIGV